ncbi:diguanylate cyclase domain-containing protein [Thauera sp.]|jgi:diguanylate cyclase (GGDEF)-like protein|uniref:diguanylate cyclase domain-containing protein n=1 Tax=Thauera sp. TaxID=1905334 RepID=UPI002A3588C6|nr:diguanylate cyclase [Thauera sp.]MDX9885775.1 diguanylate cyclase [Thauera sp.]
MSGACPVASRSWQGRCARLLCGLLLCLGPGAALAAHTLVLAVSAQRTPEQMLQRWEPLTAYLEQHLGDTRVSLLALRPADLRDHLARQTVDIVITDAGDYVLLRRHNPLTSPLATIVPRAHGNRVIGTGGVIFARSDRTELRELNALRGARIAAPAPSSLGGYQAQLMALFENGIDLGEATPVQFLGSTHDAVVDAVLSGTADVGFARSGILEELTAEARLPPGALQIINRQNLPSYPYAVSTRLYPNAPVFAAAHVEPAIARRVAAALMMLDPDDPAARAAGIAGFEPAVDYEPVEDLLRTLRLPPYDMTPSFGLADIWIQHPYSVVLGVAGLLAVSVLALALGLTNRRLRTEKATLEHARMDLAASVHQHRETLHELENERARLQAQEEVLRNLAHFDPLTGLPNRRLFSDRLNHSITRARRTGKNPAVGFVDLDDFKPINDRFGHEAGDRVLAQIAQRLHDSVRSADSVARMGGDEFALLFDEADAGADGLAPLLERIVHALEAPIDVGGQSVVVTASIGIALYPQHGGDEDALMQAADRAMYAAKAAGASTYHFSDG